MKKIIALMLVLVLAFAVVGCNQEPAHDHDHNHSQTGEIASNTKPVTKPIDKAPTFSYEEDQKTYSKETAGVKTEGFKNTEKATVTTIEEAITLAKKEQTIKGKLITQDYPLSIVV